MKRQSIKSLSLQAFAHALAHDGLILETGPFLIRLKVPFDELVRPLRLLLGEMICILPGSDPPPILDYDVSLRFANPVRRLIRPRVTIDLDGQQWLHPFPRPIALPMLCWAINSCTFTYPHQYLILHAGVVAKHGHVLIMPGTSGAGKSTLTAALVLRGWQLLSDEIALVDPDTGLIHPCPLPLSLKENAIQIIKDFQPDLKIGPVVPGTAKGRIAHLPVPHQAVELAQQPLPAAWMVFPHYHPDHTGTLHPMTSANALQQCGLESFNYSILGEEGFRIHTQLIRQCQCFELCHADLDRAVATLDTMAIASASSSTGALSS